MCSSLRCSGSQSVSQTINALISGTRHHKVSIHYAWVASARSPSWTFSADWRSCVDSQVLFKAHLYVRALLRLCRCYIPTLEGLKWAPVSPQSAQGKKKKVIEVRHQTLGQPHSAASRTAVWWTATLADLSQPEWCFKSLNTWRKVLSTSASSTFFLHTAEDDFRHAGYADEVVTEPSKVIVKH